MNISHLNVQRASSSTVFERIENIIFYNEGGDTDNDDNNKYK